MDSALARVPVPVADLVDRLASVPGREDRLTHLEVLPPRAARTADWPAWAAADVVAAFTARGVRQPWAHQAAAAEAAHAGEHVVLATGTASGKSLAYQLPALSAIRTSRGPRGRRGSTVLYLAPDQGAGPGPARRDPRARPRRPGDHPRRRQRPRPARLGPRPRRVRPHQPRHAAPLAAARARSAGRSSWARWPTWSSTSATTTAGCSAPTCPTCCGGCGGSARRTARTRRSCSPRRRWPSRRWPRTG